ncbi:hypothetical protein CC1G_04587 [Coprinopsis cinerea okayama7|uniref:Uncharacterized protein n=1 Tax=Coprinopsis cinerea (strain Okayama-7 / 130 / ATCC MYA-4618 / FGSC 9003) TaxID=240176 RepID=A8N509_COPC7|nr:hypothetical protein CC1G_04587 [Coprinopsis cinerea okayama7\|eukprot:XP_001829898.1 hypothetical protein CC1G_04587 [Coprinopsis cinerea okayama7\
MDPGEVPEIRTVTRFPAQAQSGGDCKIPSIIYYDTQGKVCVVGAEATAEGIEEQAEDNGWFKAEWHILFPFRSRPSLTPDTPGSNYTSVRRLFADYMKYLFDCSETYIKETHTSGDLLWNTLKDDILFVLTHPNGWEGPQQTQMRRAAVQAGLVSDSEEGHARVMFVTEGEASLHFCINNGLSGDGLESGKGVVIVDAGGGTIDVSAYQGRGGVFNEISAAQCHFQGSVFVTSRAEEYMKQHLNGTRFEADIPVIVKRFDTRTKHTFRSDSEMQFIQFGSPRETDLALDIRRGQMKLKGQVFASVVAGFFEPSIKCIVGAVEEQMANRHYPISTVFLVGGFAASDWLYNQVKNRLERRGVKVFRPDTHTNKAVSDGAASFYLDHLVGTRVSKFDYGLNSFVFFDPYDPEHFKRRSKMREHSITRHLILNDCFSVILFRGTQVAERTEFRGRYDHWLKPNEDLTQFRVYIQCYRGDGPCPEWMDGEDSNSFSQVCCVTADVSSIVPAWQFSPLTGQYHSRIAFDVVLLFGLTELRAQIAWMVNGVEKRGPAKIVYL